MKHDQSAFRQAYSGQRDIEDRVRRFLPLVHKAAWHIYGAGRDGIEVEDLVQVGLVALTDCARRHTGPTEDGFAAYAKMRVRGSMFDVLRKSAPVSRSTIKRLMAYDRCKEEYERLNGRQPTAAELADLLGIDAVALRELEQENIRFDSLDNQYDDHSTAFADEGPDPFELVVQNDDSETLSRCIADLPERLKLVLQMYFVEEQNLAEIAEILDVSVPRIHQLKASALKQLREMLAEQTDLKA